MGSIETCYENKVPFHKRLKYAQLLLRKYPDRVPVIIELSQSSKSLFTLQKNKFLVPMDIDMRKFMANCRPFVKSNMGVSNESIALFFLCDNKLIPPCETMGKIYSTYRHADGLVYFVISGENTFGK